MTNVSRLFVRNSTGLVREASALDATIFNAAISAPVGSTLAYSIFFTLVAFPGADVPSVLLLTVILNVPVLIMFALLAVEHAAGRRRLRLGEPDPVAAARS